MKYILQYLIFISFAFSLESAPQIANYGQWESPITVDHLLKESGYVINMLIEGSSTYTCELRPSNQGKYTVVKRDPSGLLEDMTPPDFNVRTFVHEYGGGAFTVHEGVIYASSGDDGEVYIIKPGQTPIQLTQSGTRFADMHYTPYGLLAVAEHHGKDNRVENFLALIDLETGAYKKVASGYDFYASPAISADGKKVAWISWNFPNMPWSNSELWVAEFDSSGNFQNQKQIAGDIPEAIFQPQWSLDGKLYFVTDRDKGWWNIHRYYEGKIENVCPMEAEVAEPQWIFQLSTYAFLEDQIVFTYNQEGKWNLGVLNPEIKEWKKLDRDSTEIHYVQAGDHFVQFYEKYAMKGESLIQLDSSFSFKTLQDSKADFDEDYISQGRHITFPSNGRFAHGFYYPPKNKDFIAPLCQNPPLIVMSHGGPTAQSMGSFSKSYQFWTSRGFAILDVNYGGSSGYGRAFRESLNGNCGVIDVEDCVNGALYLAELGFVDGDKLAIRGASAGGYITLAALTYFDVFKAGASYFGISDLIALDNSSHKFEAKYTDNLYGLDKEVWKARSPLYSIEKIQAPLILFQGENDKIVPKEQSILIYDALKKRGVPVELHLYEGEEHGFRKAEHIKDAFKKEHEFYLKVFQL